MPLVSQAQDENSFRNILRNCKHCGEHLRLQNMRDIERKFFCSTSCARKHEGPQLAARLKTGKNLNCAMCGTPFIQTVARHKHCSKACSKRSTYLSVQQRLGTLDGYLHRLMRPIHRPALDATYIKEIFDRQKGLCALSGVPMTYLLGNGNIHTNISIDQIIPSAGYSRDNVHLVCRIVNVMKHNLSVDEFKGWCALILGRLTFP